MAHRSGVYVAFHAGGTTDPTASDIKYYNMMKGWQEHKNIDFSFSNSHDRTPSVRDTSLKATLEARLITRLRNSKVLLLITSSATRLDTDWVPFEIRYAIDDCKLPVIVAYPHYRSVVGVNHLAHLWPDDLASRIRSDRVRTLHVPFKLAPLKEAIDTYSVHNPPPHTMSWFLEGSYRKWGLLDEKPAPVAPAYPNTLAMPYRKPY